MNCKECGNRMFLDDVHTIRRGNFDNYWVCTVCETSCIELVRCGISLSEKWYSENNGKSKEYIVKN